MESEIKRINRSLVRPVIAGDKSLTGKSTEKVLQFGTGVLLRGLPDYFIDKANKEDVFNGSIVVVKSTATGGVSDFEEQDCIYTVCVRGISNGEVIEEYILNESISRVLSANEDWPKILRCAHDPEMRLIISNTTEVGIVLVEESIFEQPPKSFPAKLLAFLFERYKAFEGKEQAGMIIIPTELIVDNATVLKEIVHHLAVYNKLDEAFVKWLLNENDFCNSLVDRIVPGKLPQAEYQAVEQKLGYHDELMILAEHFRLWAIETSNSKVREFLSFAKVDEGVVIAEDINKFRELKLRLLNGTHTFCCGLAYLRGYETVKEAMSNESFIRYVEPLMFEEIVPAVVSKEITHDEAMEYARSVIDRFRNPFLAHKWLSISLNYTSKMLSRNVPLLLRHYEMHGGVKKRSNGQHPVPHHMALGFAAFIAFMRCEKAADGKYYGSNRGVNYQVQDEMAPYFAAIWKSSGYTQMVHDILSNLSLWRTDLSVLPGFEQAVHTNLLELI